MLTEARAMVVRDYLIEHSKLDDKRLKTIGFGKDEKTPDGGSIQILVYAASDSEKTKQ